MLEVATKLWAFLSSCTGPVFLIADYDDDYPRMENGWIEAGSRFPPLRGARLSYATSSDGLRVLSFRVQIDAETAEETEQLSAAGSAALAEWMVGCASDRAHFHYGSFDRGTIPDLIERIRRRVEDVIGALRWTELRTSTMKTIEERLDALRLAFRQCGNDKSAYRKLLIACLKLAPDSEAKGYLQAEMESVDHSEEWHPVPNPDSAELLAQCVAMAYRLYGVPGDATRQLLFRCYEPDRGGVFQRSASIEISHNEVERGVGDSVLLALRDLHAKLTTRSLLQTQKAPPPEGSGEKG